jgi:hypothetical protein
VFLHDRLNASHRHGAGPNLSYCVPGVRISSVARSCPHFSLDIHFLSYIVTYDRFGPMEHHAGREFEKPPSERVVVSRCDKIKKRVTILVL